MTSRASDILNTAAATLTGLAKLVLLSRRPTITSLREAVAPAEGDPCPVDNAPSPTHSHGAQRVSAKGPIIILGNGPSLNQTIAESLTILQHTPTMAVNFAANAPVFTDIKPTYYILVDPLFYSGRDLPNLNMLWQRLGAVDWPMTLIVPVGERRHIPASATANPNIRIATINAIGIDGARWLTDWAYAHGRGMPRPRNVLIAAIMAAVQMGYREIYITGADHSWMSSISVNERNEVVSIQPHFYKEDDREVRRINTEYLHHPLHEVVYSFYVAFRSYHQIQDYARRHGIAIYNSTPTSFIDAFDRRPLPASK